MSKSLPHLDVLTILNYRFFTTLTYTAVHIPWAFLKYFIPWSLHRLIPPYFFFPFPHWSSNSLYVAILMFRYVSLNLRPTKYDKLYCCLACSSAIRGSKTCITERVHPVWKCQHYPPRLRHRPCSSFAVVMSNKLCESQAMVFCAHLIIFHQTHPKLFWIANRRCN
jgi:hypothetical protein